MVANPGYLNRLVHHSWCFGTCILYLNGFLTVRRPGILAATLEQNCASHSDGYAIRNACTTATMSRNAIPFMTYAG